MDHKIALEEHFSIAELVDNSKVYFDLAIWDEVKKYILDIHEYRLAKMDKNNIELSILSQNSPAIQGISNKLKAIEMAKRSNDFLAEQISKNPTRFKGFAALPMQDPNAAIEELIRCINELGFVGALVNGFSELDNINKAIYYDLDQYWPFWEIVEKLGVPFYLYPREPYITQQQCYEGHPWLLGSAWAFGCETATHALRLMASGLFDKYPKLTIILGHMGEMLPFVIWRIDHRIKWSARGIKAKRPLGDYFKENFYITTSGNFRTQALINAILEIGADKILFSTDYPFEKMTEATEWFDQATISEIDRIKIGCINAKKLFKII
ncbi:amidohydrolase family protein [Legionella sp. D16C41]|uniref:amidohydrolase family protein n=1 Tax=Legionella sp. D16C41 TaxID=3402688 RepID=UPI003AF9BAF1